LSAPLRPTIAVIVPRSIASDTPVSARFSG